jgi:hypothetical protein
MDGDCEIPLPGASFGSECFKPLALLDEGLELATPAVAFEAIEAEEVAGFLLELFTKLS